MEYQDLTDIRAAYLGSAENRDTVRKGAKLINEYLEAGWTILSPEDVVENMEEPIKKPLEVQPDGSAFSDRLIEICENETITPEFLLAAHGLPAEDWKVIAYRNNYWHSQIKGGQRLIMYQSRLTVKPYKDDEISPEFIRKWFQQFEPKPVEYEYIAPDYGSGDNQLVLPIVDLHYNLLSTKFITGNEYNCQIAKDRFLSVIDDVTSRVNGKKLSKIIFPVGNDLFNANGINGTTFKGTPQTNEKDIREAYTELFELMVFAIDKIKDIAPVDIVYVPSNHDKEVTFYFIHALSVHYFNDFKVEVDISPIHNKYRRVGNTLLMFSHDAKVDKMGNVVLDEAQEFMAGVKYVEVMLSHLHQEMVKQERNVTVRRLPTFSGRSVWTCEQNYGANSLCQSFIVNDERNITDIMYTMV